MVCNAFDISRSSYYEYRQRRDRVDVERLVLKAQVSRLFKKSRSSAGSRCRTKKFEQVSRTSGQQYPSQAGLLLPVNLRQARIKECIGQPPQHVEVQIGEPGKVNIGCQGGMTPKPN